MPRRLLTPLLAAVALLLLSAPAGIAASTAAPAPAARSATDDDGGCSADEMEVEDDDGTVTCSGEDAGDDSVAGDDESGDEGDVGDLCDDWSDDGDDGSSDEGGWSGDEGDTAEISSADDSGDDADCTDEADGAAPLVSGLRATVAGHGGRAHVTVGYSLDVAGSVTLTLERTAAGVSSGKRCVLSAAKPAGGKASKAKHAHRGGKSCTRATAVRGSVATAGDAGVNTLDVRRWKGRRLAPGSYRLTALPAGDGAVSATTTFKLLAR
jgi:hypothetical protein